MTIFYTSDTHFGHKNIIRYSNRPFKDVSHMNEVLIRRWNEVVQPNDTIYHLGDVAMGPWEDWDGILTRLNGYKILVVGNHDRVFRGNKDSMIQKFRPHYEHWFNEVHDNIEGLWLDDGTLVNMSHFPYTGDSHDADRYDEYRLVDRGRVLIHGHTHAEHVELGYDALVSRSKRGTLQIHVGVDAWGYAPVSEDAIIDLIDEARSR